MTDTLDARFQNLILQLTIKSHASAGNVARSRSAPDSVIPHGETHTIEAELCERYNSASSIKRKLEVYKQAEDELASWIRPQEHRDIEPLNDAQLLLEDGEGYSASEAAAKFGVPVGHVYYVRKRAGRRVDDGREITPHGLDVKERRSEAKRLRRDNLSIRQIASILGISTYTVSVDLRRT